MNIKICTENITDFAGDVIIIPCDSELTNRKIGIVPKILEKGGADLIRELAAIGYCEVGYDLLGTVLELIVLTG